MPKISIQNPQTQNTPEAADLQFMLDVINDEYSFIHQMASLVRAIEIADDTNGMDRVFLSMVAISLMDSQLEKLGDHETYFLKTKREANKGGSHE